MLIIYILLYILLFFFLLLCLNLFYFKVIKADSQEEHIIRGMKGKYDAIAFGSAYCRYGIDFSETNINGYNFGYASQFLYYTDLMLKYITPKCLNAGGDVYIILADLVFASIGKKELNYKGILRFLPYSILRKEHSLGDLMKARYPIFYNYKIIKDIIRYAINTMKNKKYLLNDYNSLTINQLDYESVEKMAKKRCNAWCGQFGLKDTFDGDKIPLEIEKTFEKTQKILSNMIDFCVLNGYRPVLIVTPVSEAMRKCLGESFIDKVLISNINKANAKGVEVIFELEDESFTSIEYYHNNADFLNSTGRKMFTQKIVERLYE